MDMVVGVRLADFLFDVGGAGGAVIEDADADVFAVALL